MLSTGSLSPIEQIFIDYKLLNVQQLIDFDTANIMYKSQNNLAPQYIIDMFVPSSQIHDNDIRHATDGLSNSSTIQYIETEVLHRHGADCEHYSKRCTGSQNINSFKTGFYLDQT